MSFVLFVIDIYFSMKEDFFDLFVEFLGLYKLYSTISYSNKKIMEIKSIFYCKNSMITIYNNFLYKFLV